MTGSTAIVIIVLAAVGVLAAVLGLTIYAREHSRAPRTPARRRLPQQWPLNPRPLANSKERHVWHWLQSAFPDHHIMLKLPVTRFTMPRQRDEGQEWFELLTGAYCSFTLCNDHGHVVGCVDVMGPRGLARGNRQLKQSLLAQCGIGYWVLSPESMPDPHVLRAEFLGAANLDSQPPILSEQAQLDSVRHQLHEVLDRNRNQRYNRALDSAATDDDHEVTPWPQPDSFLGALDSRRAPLERT